MKRIISILSILLICIMLLTGCNKNNGNEKDNNVKNDKPTVEVNINENVVKNQNIDGIEILNTSLIYENGISYLKATVVNNTGSDYELSEYRIYIKDVEGNIIAIMPGNIGGVIRSGEAKPINAMISEDLSKAYSIEYEVVK